jgi:8-hydroxy-5-deazaflavin:NADPH oxidoreductase
MGTRSPAETLQFEKFAEWHNINTRVKLGTFAQGALHADIILYALKGEVTLELFTAMDSNVLNGKIISDVSNPLDSSNGFPPTLLVGLNNTNSLAEEI